MQENKRVPFISVHSEV